MTKYILSLFAFIFSVSITAQEQYAVYFDTGKDTLNTIFSAELQNWMDWHKSVTVVKIKGYADGVGKTDANSSLSQRRATTIATLLEKNGVTLDEKVLIQGLGETGKDKDDAQSRKVIIYFEKAKPKANPLEKQLKKAKVGSKIPLSKLAFERNSGRALPGSTTLLNNLVAIMQANPNLKIDIQGHICCNPDDPKKLGLLRAKTVYNHLINGGIDKSRVSYQSFGGTRPIYPIPEQNAVEAEANRRVEIEIIAN
jgi:outer membrane protein OmpA-like peptidoglycan-associated protein